LELELLEEARKEAIPPLIHLRHFKGQKGGRTKGEGKDSVEKGGKKGEPKRGPKFRNWVPRNKGFTGGYIYKGVG